MMIASNALNQVKQTASMHLNSKPTCYYSYIRYLVSNTLSLFTTVLSLDQRLWENIVHYNFLKPPDITSKI